MTATRLSGFGTTIFTEMSALAETTGAINLGQGFPDEDGPAAVLEAATSAIRAGHNQYAPLPGVPALRRFSIDRGRLAWVTPSGQDGQDSSVQVLGWSGNEFGEMHGIPAKQMYLVR